MHACEVHLDRVEDVDPSCSFGGDARRVQVRAIAVARTCARDLTVGAVVEERFALAEAELQDASLPPAEHRLALVGLDLEVGRGLPGGQRFEPHQVARLIDDHRPGRALALVGREEEVAGARPRLCRGGDAHGRGRQRRRGRVVLDRARIARVVGELFLGDRRLMGDREGGLGRARCRTGDLSADRDALARLEGVARNEALARAGRVGAQHTAVAAAARAHDVHRRDGRTGRAEEADLRAPRGIGCARLRRDGDRVGCGEMRRNAGAAGSLTRARGATAGCQHTSACKRARAEDDQAQVHDISVPSHRGWASDTPGDRTGGSPDSGSRVGPATPRIRMETAQAEDTGDPPRPRR